jgi:hypothetical protein
MWPKGQTDWIRQRTMEQILREKLADFQGEKYIVALAAACRDYFALAYGILFAYTFPSNYPCIMCNNE